MNRNFTRWCSAECCNSGCFLVLICISQFLCKCETLAVKGCCEQHDVNLIRSSFTFVAIFFQTYCQAIYWHLPSKANLEKQILSGSYDENLITIIQIFSMLFIWKSFKIDACEICTQHWSEWQTSTSSLWNSHGLGLQKQLGLHLWKIIISFYLQGRKVSFNQLAK